MLALNTLVGVGRDASKSHIIVRPTFRTEEIPIHPLHRTFAGKEDVNPDEWGCQNPQGNSDEVQTRKNDRKNCHTQYQYKHFLSLE